MMPDGSRHTAFRVSKVGPELLARLDRHEGVPRFYVCERIELGNGNLVESYLLYPIKCLKITGIYSAF